MLPALIIARLSAGNKQLSTAQHVFEPLKAENQ